MKLEKIKTLIKRHNLATEDSVLEIQQLPNSANETLVVTIKHGESCNKIFIKI